MANKEATVFCIDVGHHMRGKTYRGEIDGELSDLELAVRYVQARMIPKILSGRKTDCVGTVLFGAESTNNRVTKKGIDGYDGIEELHDVHQGKLSTLQDLTALVPGPQSADPISAIVVAIDMLRDYCKHLKYIKNIICVTNGLNDEIVDTEFKDVADLCAQIEAVVHIVGVDFDDESINFHELKKPRQREENERKLRSFASAFAQGDCTISNLSEALRRARLPQPREVRSAATKIKLTIGDTEKHPESSLEIGVAFSAATKVVRAETAKRWSIKAENAAKLARPEEFTFGIERNVQYQVPVEDSAVVQLRAKVEEYLAKGGSKENEEYVTLQEQLNDLELRREPREDEELVKAWKYGGIWVPIEQADEDMLSLPVTKGIQVLAFISQQKLQRDLFISETSYVIGETGPDMIALSSLIQACHESGKCPLVRFVKSEAAHGGRDPKLGVLIPMLHETWECFIYVQLPFAEDVRRYRFPALSSVTTASGKVLKEHPKLPTTEQKEAMDNFVDAMSLVGIVKSESAEPTSWFDQTKNFHPSVHRIRQCTIDRALHGKKTLHCAIDAPDSTSGNLGPSSRLPPMDPELVKYASQPPILQKRNETILARLAKTLDIKKIPPKQSRGKRKREEDPTGSVIDLEALGVRTSDHSAVEPAEVVKEEEESQTLIKMSPSNGSQHHQERSNKARDGDSDATEESDDEQVMVDVKSSPSQHIVAPLTGKITTRVGHSHPIEDFKDMLSTTGRGADMFHPAIQSAMEAAVVIVTHSMGDARYAILLELLTIVRKVALQSDEEDTYLEGIKNLRRACMSQKRHDFWREVEDRQLADLE